MCQGYTDAHRVANLSHYYSILSHASDLSLSLSESYSIDSLLTGGLQEYEVVKK